MVASEMDTVKYAKLESTIDKITLFGTIITLGLIICFILYNIQKAVLNKKPKIKKTKPLVVVKTGKKDSTKKDSETTPIVEDKKAPLKNTPVNEPKPINPKEPMTFSLFIDDIKRKKDIKKTLKLEALKAKTLMQKPGDIVEEISIEETNKALAGGVLKKLLKAIMQAKKPKETKETKPNPTGETKSKNKPKAKPTASSSVSTPPKDNTRGRSNDKNNKDKSTPKSKDKK
jgi:cell division septation protein DedD